MRSGRGVFRASSLLHMFVRSRRMLLVRFLRWCSVVTGVGFSIVFAGLCSSPVRAQGRTLNAVFTPAPIQVDGHPKEAWNRAAPSDIEIYVYPRGAAQPGDNKVSGTAQALWNGSLLYLLFTVNDPDITTVSPMDTGRSSVQLYVDQFDDKFPKFEEDDSYILISAAGQQTGNRTNAGLTYYPPVWSSHLHSYAAALRTDSSGRNIGYTVEVAWYIGDLPLKNGTKLGMEFVLNAASSANNRNLYKVYWSSGNNRGLDDNTMWGDVILTGYDDISPMPLKIGR